MMADISRFFATPPRDALSLARWLAAVWPLSLLLGGSVADGVATLIALLFLFHSILHKDWGWLNTRWVQAAFLLWLYTLLRSTWVEDTASALERALTWVRFPLIAAALSHGVLQEDNARITWLGLVAATVLLALDGLLQYATGADALGHPLFDIGGGVMRLTGPFSSPKLGIVLVGLAFPAILPLLAGKQPLLGIVLAVAVLFVIFMSGERMALLLCLFGISLAFVLWRGALKARLGIAFLLALVLAGGMLADPARMQRQYHSTVAAITHFNETAYGMLWQSGLTMAKENPLFGVGPKQFRQACDNPRYGSMDLAVLPLRCNLHPHNIYIEWLAETGIIGFLLFIIILTGIFTPLLRALPIWRGEALYLGLIIVAILRFWPLAATTSFFAGWMAAPTWFLLGWALYAAKPR